MSASQQDGSHHGPGWAGIVFGILFSALLGFFLVCTWLVFQPVQKVTALPKDAPAGRVFFIEGATNSHRGAVQELKLFFDGSATSLILTEGDLNELLAASPVPKKGDLMALGLANYRISAGQIQVARRVEIPLLALGVIAQARGSFSGDGAPVFNASAVSLGGLQASKVPFLGSFFISLFQLSPELVFGGEWPKVGSVTHSGRVIELKH